MIPSSFRSGSSMYFENPRMLALDFRMSAQANRVGSQEKLSQAAMTPIYPDGRVCRANALFAHTDTKVLPIPCPVASFACCGAIQVCASNLERKSIIANQGRIQGQNLAALFGARTGLLGP
jgi:hypothetical protein